MLQFKPPLLPIDLTMSESIHGLNFHIPCIRPAKSAWQIRLQWLRLMHPRLLAPIFPLFPHIERRLRVAPPKFKVALPARSGLNVLALVVYMASIPNLRAVWIQPVLDRLTQNADTRTAGLAHESGGVVQAEVEA
jgi:hypothetical protein